MEDKDHIELRSEKVRNFIGKMPPTVVKIGNGTLFLVFILLIVISNFFYYNNKIVTKAVIKKNKDTIFTEIYISHANYKDVSVGQEVEISFASISGIYDKFITLEIIDMPKKITIESNSSYYKVIIPISNYKLEANNIDLLISDEIHLVATIKTKKETYFQRIINILI